jgi:hypothetical protein
VKASRPLSWPVSTPRGAWSTLAGWAASDRGCPLSSPTCGPNVAHANMQEHHRYRQAGGWRSWTGRTILLNFSESR